MPYSVLLLQPQSETEISCQSVLAYWTQFQVCSGTREEGKQWGCGILTIWFWHLCPWCFKVYLVFEGWSGKNSNQRWNLKVEGGFLMNENGQLIKDIPENSTAMWESIGTKMGALWVCWNLGFRFQNSEEPAMCHAKMHLIQKFYPAQLIHPPWCSQH